VNRQQEVERGVFPSETGFQPGSYSIIKRKSCFKVPEFVYNTQQMQHVLAVRAWRFLHTDKPVPADIVSRWEDLDAEVTARNWRYFSRKYPRWQAKKDITYLALQLAIAYAVWRQGLRARDVAEQYEVPEAVVRRVLTGFVRTANLLGYPTSGLTAEFRKGWKKWRTPTFTVIPLKNCECGCGRPAPLAKHTFLKFGRVKGQPCRFIRGHHSDYRVTQGREVSARSAA